LSPALPQTLLRVFVVPLSMGVQPDEKAGRGMRRKKNNRVDRMVLCFMLCPPVKSVRH
jgi:hypothetical protein